MLRGALATLGTILAPIVLLLSSTSCGATRVGPESLSPQAVTLALPIVKQNELHACGLAALASLCGYWGVEIPAEERASLARTAAESEGLSGGELRETLERLGLEVFLFAGSLDREPTGLLHHVDEGRPVLVMLAEGATTRHYCLVIGYDEPRGNLLLLDPVRGEVLLSTVSFARAWEICDRFSLLAVPHEETTRTRKGVEGTKSDSRDTSHPKGGMQS